MGCEMKYQYVVDKLIDGRWVRGSTWRMEPRLLGRFLREYRRMFNIQPNRFRVRRDETLVATHYEFLPDGTVERV